MLPEAPVTATLTVFFQLRVSEASSYASRTARLVPKQHLGTRRGSGLTFWVSYERRKTP